MNDTFTTLTKNFNALSIQSIVFGMGIPCSPPPVLWACPHAMAVIWFWCCGCVETSHSVKWGYKPLQLAARVPLQLGGTTPHQGRRHQFIANPDMEGYLPITSPSLWSCKLWPSSVSSCVSHGVHHLMASMGSDVIPSAKCTCSFRCPHPLQVTWNLHLLSVDAPVDIHGRSDNFPIIHPREVLLAEWLGDHPDHCSLVASSYLHFPWKWACMGWGWYICPMHDRHLYTRECNNLWCDEKKPVLVEDAWPSTLVHHFIGGDISQWSDAPPCIFPLPTYP